MGSFNRQSYIASEGNLAVKAGGDPLYPDGTGDTLDLRVGEIVVFDPKNNVTLAAGDIATAENIAIGVGYGKGEPGTIAEGIRHLDNGKNLCKTVYKANAAAPVCPCAQQYDFYFDCTQCDETYTLELLLDDSLVRSRYGTNEKAKYIYTINTECCNCDDCSPEHNCEELSCKFVDQINQNFCTDPSKIVRFQRRSMDHQYQPFHALPLFDVADSWKELELTPAADGTVADITSVDVNGTVTTFVGTTVPGDATKTYVSQLSRVEEQLNAALESTGGRAFIYVPAFGECDVKIYVSSCVAVTLTDHIWTLTENPFEDITYGPDCQTCGATASTFSPTCGFRIITDPVDVSCLCDFPPNEPVPNYYGRTIEGQFLGDGWVCKNFYTKEVCEQVLPENFGYFFSDAARFQSTGGIGKDYRRTNTRRGLVGLPDEYSRASNASVGIDCGKLYCAYDIVPTQGIADTTYNNALTYYNKSKTTVLIPSADSTTITSWETYLAALATRGICVPVTLECTTE